jgi:hypothetical protein
MFQSYFIHFHFANPVVFPEFTLWNESAHHEVKHFFNPMLSHTVKLLHFLLGVGRYFSASAAATQKTLHAPPQPCKSAAKERAKRLFMD